MNSATQATTDAAIFATQRISQAVIRAMAHPGRIVEDQTISMSLVIETFAPAGTRCHLAPSLAAIGVTVPGAVRPFPPEQAGVAAAEADEASALLACLPRGSLMHPEEGALLILRVAAITDAAEAASGSRVLHVGRGAAGGRDRALAVTGLTDDFLAARAAAVAAYPTGVDIVLVDEANGRVAGLPRHSAVIEGVR